jgi:hypothetical protein
MNTNGQNNGSPRIEKADQGMKRLQIIALSAIIFAITGFGISEWENVFHKANTSGLLRNIQISWNRSLTETGNELNAIFTGPQWQTAASKRDWKALSDKVLKDTLESLKTRPPLQEASMKGRRSDAMGDDMSEEWEHRRDN